MDATQLLKSDHEKVSELFRRFAGGGGLTGLVRRVAGRVTPRERQTALERICRELQIHTAIEEEIFYPTLRRTGDPELCRQLDEAAREHGTVKKQVAQLEGRSAEDQAVVDQVHALQECVDHHVSEEENEMFPRVHEILSDRERADLGRRLRDRKRALSGTRTTRPTTRARRPATTRAGAAKKSARTAKSPRTATASRARKKKAATRPRAR
jgi:hemerythrin superfamily protein